MIKINNIEEGKKYIRQSREEILFQNKVFFSKEKFADFINEIENGTILKMPEKSIKHSWYCNFGDFYCDTFILTKKYIIFFDNETLIYMKQREKTDDVEMSWYDEYKKAYCSCNPLMYNDELDEQFDEAGLCKKWIK